MSESAFPPAQLAELLSALNAELKNQSMGEVLQVLQEANLSMPRLVALLYLRRRGSASISEVSEHLHLALASTSQAIDQLVQAGLVERREGATDRRHKRLTLTPAGASIVGRVRQIHLDEITRRLSSLPPAVVERLGTALADALETLQLEQPAAQR